MKPLKKLHIVSAACFYMTVFLWPTLSSAQLEV